MSGKEKYRNLKILAKKRGYGIVELAEKIGVTDITLRNGIIDETIQLKYLKRIIELLHIDPSFFFDNLEDNEKVNKFMVAEPEMKYGDRSLLEEMMEQMKIMRKMIEEYQRRERENKP